MTPKQIRDAASEAVKLLTKSPFIWLAAIVIFLILSEITMFIPYVGFIVKLLVSILLAAGIIDMLSHASMGAKPPIKRIFSAFTLPIGAKITLFASVAIPFAVGIAYLYAQAGQSGIAYFFGNILRDKPPSKELFTAFKTIMYLTATPLIFVGAAVVLQRLSGLEAFKVAIGAAVRHWQAALTLLVMNIAFEQILAITVQALSAATTIVLTVFLLILYAAWSAAFSYTLAVRALTLVSETPEAAT